MHELLDRKKPILILSAMEMEADLLLKKLENKKKLVIDGYNFYIGNINKTKVVVCVSGIMATNVSLAAYIGIKKFSPAFVIQEGSAGGYTKNVHSSDIVLASKSVDITRVITPFKEKGSGSNSLEWELVEFDEKSENFYTKVKYQYGTKQLISSLSKAKYSHGNILSGTVGSGNIWNNEIDKIEWLNEYYGVVCEDMETHTVYSVCDKYNVPVVSARVITNNIITKEEFSTKPIEHLQEYLIGWVAS